ncbi:AMP-binding protein [Actinokineospora sp. G85]|uniref:AMP-binding protein n=1 Tax=Actinokineospora sp. G85 TaxID=3406626 RepID=UPI003C745A02
MQPTPFAPHDPADVARRVRAALPERAGLSGRPGAELASAVDSAVDSAAAAVDDAGPGAVVAVAGEPVDVLVGCLGAWLAGAVPWVGPGAPGGAALPGTALVVSEPLVGCVAHPAQRLGGLEPPEGAERVVVHADWRVDAWLPAVCAALLAGVPQVELVAAGSAASGSGGVLAFPGHAVPAGAEGFDHWLTWGAERPDGGPGQRHGFGDHFVLAPLDPPTPGQGPRGRVPGRHRVLGAAGRPIPDNAWGVLGLAGVLPVVADTPDDLLAADRGDRTWVTDQRARRRSDGAIEFDTAGPVRFAGRRLAPALVRRALAEAGLADAALLARDAGTDRARLVLHTAEGADTSRVGQALPDWARPLGVAVLPALPRTEDGAVDAAALAETAAPDDWLLAHAERVLSEAAGGQVRLRAATTPPELAARPLPAGFEANGGHYPADRLAESAGPELAPPTDSLADRLRAAADSGRGILLVDGDGTERELPYRALLDDAARIAAFLKSRGLGEGDEVIVHCADPADLLAGIWGCVLSGALAVPITPASPYDGAGNPMWHLLGPTTMLTRDLVLTTADQAERTEAALAGRGLSATALLLEDARGHEPLAESDWTIGTHAFLLLTSGSTGAPKGVPLGHRNLVSLAEAVGREFAFDRGAEVSLNWLAVDHVGGLVQHHIRDLCLANRQIHVDTAYVMAKPTRMLDLMSEHRVTLAWQANFGFNMLNEQAAEISRGQWDLSGVKLWENGGEAVTHDGNQRFLALLAPHGLRPDVVKPVFGMTETSSAIIAAHNLVLGRHDNVHWLAESGLDQPVVRALPGAGSAFVEVGGPMAGVAMRVVDAEGQLCPEGVIGRIEVSGPQVFDGYYRNPEANADAFSPDGWLRMGDLGFMAGGSLVVTGREKEVIIVNGLNFAARALEGAVEALPGVRQGCCAAVSVRRPEAVTDDLVVFVSSAETAAVDPAQVEAALLAEFSLRPIAVVELDPAQWPRTAIGKIRRPPLAQGFLAGEFAERIVLQRDSGVGERAELPAFLFAPRWRKAAPAPAVARRVLWLGDGAPAAAPASAGGERAEDLAALLTDAAARLGGLDAVVDTVLRTPAAGADPAERAVAALERAHTRWDALCKAATALDSPPALVLAVDEAFAVTGDEPGIANAALPGLAESLAQSHPQLSIKVVDGASDTELLAEQAATPGQTLVAHRAGERSVAALEPLPVDDIPATPARVLTEGGHYLVIGGLGGVGALLCQHLVQRFNARLTVVGRGSADARAQTLTHLTAQAATRPGAAVEYRQADATDPAALAAVVGDTAFDAVFALLGEGTIVEQVDALLAGGGQDDPRALRRAGDRIRLCHSLDTALAAHPAPVVVFSSINGFFGGAGFAHYAGACAYQAAAALRSDRGDICLDWGMWQQVGLAAGAPAELTALAERRGFAKLTPAQGLAALHVALDAPQRRVLVGLLASGSAVAPLLPADLFGHEVRADGPVEAAEVAAVLGLPADRVRAVRRGDRSASALSSPHLATLLEVFRGVLAAPEVDGDDNFFAVGGDSIRAIQVVTRAAERGIRFSALDLFEHKSVAALLAHLAESDQLAALPDPVEDDVDASAPVELPPVFDWWLESADTPEARAHLTMGMRYELDPAIEPVAVRSALLALVEQHDALRLRLVETDDGPRLTAAGSAADSLVFEVREVDPATVAGVEAELHRGLDPAAGPIARAALLRRTDRPAAQLVLVIHHAAVDGVSWRIIEDDLALLLRAGGGAVLPARTMGFFDWAHRVARRAGRVDGAALADAWAARLGGCAPVFPDAPDKQPREGDAVVLNRTVTAPALGGADASVNEVLLAAVAWSLARWTGRDDFAVDVEGHGRLERELPVDLSRTVGWFTAIAPLRLDVTGCATPAEAVPRARRALEDTRGRHLEWGLLRHLGACPAGHPLRALPERQISFNYLGVFDAAAAGEADAPLSAVPGSLTAEQSPESPRRYLVDIAAQVSAGDLEVAVKFSPEAHPTEEVERWLDECVAAVAELLAAEPEPVVLADLDHDELAMALQEVGFGLDD